MWIDGATPAARAGASESVPQGGLRRRQLVGRGEGLGVRRSPGGRERGLGAVARRAQQQRRGVDPLFFGFGELKEGRRRRSERDRSFIFPILFFTSHIYQTPTVRLPRCF